MSSLTNVRDIVSGRNIPFQFLHEGYNFVVNEEGAQEHMSLLCTWEDSFRLANALVDNAYWDVNGQLVRRLPTALPSFGTVSGPYADNSLPVLEESTSVANPATLFIQDIEDLRGIGPLEWNEEVMQGTSKQAKLKVIQRTVPYTIIDLAILPKLLGFEDADLTTDVYFRNETTFLLRYLSRGCGRSDFTQSLKPGLAYLWEYVTHETSGVHDFSEPELMASSLDLKFGAPEYHLTWWKVPVMGVENINRFFKHWSGFLGYTNREVFDDHEPGSLLLTGIQASIGKFFSGNLYVNVTFLLKERNAKHAWNITDVPQEAVGHDSFLRINLDGEFKVQIITTDGLLTGRRLFPKKYFYKLFDKPAGVV